MRVFVSSVVGGYERYRRAAKDAIEALGYEAVLMETHPSTSSPPQEVCFHEIETSDVLILLLGKRYGECLPSGKSATHEEFEYACELGKKILVFVEKVKEREDKQEEFLRLKETGDWKDGLFWSSYTLLEDLSPEITRALRKLENQSAEAVNKLPLDCRERIRDLGKSSPSAANQLVILLSDPASRQPDALLPRITEPPDWLSKAGYAAWEVISDFQDAHRLPNSDLTRQHAIEAGSPRRSLHLIRQAIGAADNGDMKHATRLLNQVPSDYPLLEAARARIEDDVPAVEKAIRQHQLHEAEDSDIALNSIMMLTWAYYRLERFESATEILKNANRRFEGRAWLLFGQAETTLNWVHQDGLDSPASHALFEEAAKLALRSRDLFRTWDGPSHLAVETAMRAFRGHRDLHRMVNIAQPPPEGEATTSEASEPDVLKHLAFALLMLGRYDDIDKLQLDKIDSSWRVLIQAMRARRLGDPTAVLKIRRVVKQADQDNDKTLRLKALFELALVGEIDETAMSQISDIDAALVRGIAALKRGELEESIGILTSHRFKSYLHARHLAEAYHKASNTDEAIEILTEAADQLSDISLLPYAVEILLEQDRLEEAESIVKDALTRNPSRADLYSLRASLVEIDRRREGWSDMESHARAWAQEFPDDTQAAWVVVRALHLQGENQEAWAYLSARDLVLVPSDEVTALMMLAICNSVDTSDQKINLMLEIAKVYVNSEKVSGTALAMLMYKRGRSGLNEEQETQLNELVEDFFERYPESNYLRTYPAEQPEEIAKIMTDKLRPRVEQSKSLVDRVRYGRLPYGVLRKLKELPYMELLLSLAAGEITAIPADEDRRKLEREAARDAIGGKVAVDASVAALGLHTGLDVSRMGAEFKSVLVADELIVDARIAVASSKQPADGVLVYDPGLNSLRSWENSDEQKAAAQEKAEQALDILNGWQTVKSGHLQAYQAYQDVQRDDFFKPWDAAVCVARSTGCPLWCDDLALRRWAGAEKVTAFGTWALYEVLSSQDECTWLPEVTEMKMRLLRARIADVPISLSTLEQVADHSAGLDSAVQHFLRRPAVWGRGRVQRTTALYVGLLKKLISRSEHQLAAGLLHAACCGLGVATDLEATSYLLAGTLLIVNDPGSVPALLDAARYAARELDLATKLDPLEETVRYLLKTCEPIFGAGQAAQVVMWIFSQAKFADHQIAMKVLFGDR